MDYFVKSGNPEKQRVGCVVVGIFDRRRTSAAAEIINSHTDESISRIMRRGDMDGQLGRVLVLHGLPDILADRVMLVGCGREKDFDDRAFRRVVATAARELTRIGGKDAHNCLTTLPVRNRDMAWKVRQAIMTSEAELYRFEELLGQPPAPPSLERIAFDVDSRAELPGGEAGLSSGLAIAAGTKLAKDLANRPGNVCTPDHLAQQARALAEQHPALNCTIIEREQMEELGMHALLSVAQGSHQKPRLIVAEYRAGAKDSPPIALVGKGLTFDAGGISLKPAARMEDMKFDMSGGAAVFGALDAAARMQLPLNIVGIVAASENLPDGHAIKPGDVVRSMAGITIEVINTDAEGRLILCDALTFAQREYEPEIIIDVATLTGACVTALGSVTSGLFANHLPLARALQTAGEESGDRVWQLPLYEEYQRQLKSPIADVANVGGPAAGAITAACFLHRFTRKARWAHLDIAGTAWTPRRMSSGRPVPLLVHFLMDRVDAQ